MRRLFRALAVLIGLLICLGVGFYGWAHVDKAEIIRDVSLEYYYAPDVREFEAAHSILKDFLRSQELRTQGAMWLVAAGVLTVFMIGRVVRRFRRAPTAGSPERWLWLKSPLSQPGAPVVNTSLALLFCGALSCAAFRDASLTAETAQHAEDSIQEKLAQVDGTGREKLLTELFDDVRATIARRDYYANRAEQSQRGACIWGGLGLFWIFFALIAYWRSLRTVSRVRAADDSQSSKKRPLSPYLQIFVALPCVLFGCQRLQTITLHTLNRGYDSDDLASLILGLFMLLVALLIFFARRAAPLLEALEAEDSEP